MSPRLLSGEISSIGHTFPARSGARFYLCLRLKRTPYMNTKLYTAIIYLLLPLCSLAQTHFRVSENLRTRLPDTLRERIVGSFDHLLASIDCGEPDTMRIDSEDVELNRTFFRYLKGLERKDTIPKYYRPQLIGLYAVASDRYLLTLACVRDDEIGRILTFLARNDGHSIVFSCPLKYNTRHWKTTTVGTLTYHFQDTIDMDRAQNFDRKNHSMARTLGLPVRQWVVYMCANYQEVLRLQGCLYESMSNGKVNSGDIIDPNTLFSVMNDEDFSHDILHIYASKIRGKNRNRSAECGLAYYWGNAYYPGATGKAPELTELLPVLRRYLQSRPDARLLGLFEKDPDVLAPYGYPKPVQVARVISAVICREVERQKGADGIIELLRCGSGDENFFKCIKKLVGIDRDNFEEKVRRLILE